MSEHVKQTLDFKLYLITDRTVLLNTRNSELGTQHLLVAVDEALKGGVKAVQLREKNLDTMELLDMAYKFRELTDRYNARLFINDRVDIALSVNADGVHLGQHSMPADAVKKISGGKLITGVSTHSVAEAVKAVTEGADFIIFGPVYDTPSKLKYGSPVGITALKDICSRVNIPVFAIGGIKADTTKEIMVSGSHGVAVISAILGSTGIRRSTEEFMEIIQ